MHYLRKAKSLIDVEQSSFYTYLETEKKRLENDPSPTRRTELNIEEANFVWNYSRVVKVVTRLVKHVAGLAGRWVPVSIQKKKRKKNKKKMLLYCVHYYN